MSKPRPSVQIILQQLEAERKPEYLEHMQHFGIQGENMLGIRMPVLRAMAKTYAKDHKVALELWKHDIHEAKLMAILMDEAKKVNEAQMENWAQDFNSWDVCDQACNNLFCKTRYAYDKAFAWSKREEEYVKRAGFVLMATLAIHDKKGEDSKLEAFLPYIEAEATDERNFVKKAVNWALRQIGKRSAYLHTRALPLAEALSHHESPSARWIGSDALRELGSEKVLKRLA
ncbi:DNA alkylation repair protein [Porifericola rhodea]|uniref:DNA alkylation repair protein n=1 Tax=Porifericola rhodea TaxID=930972 RepID=UPI0026665C54|nr:DNA alkylation repair protein [Porifericola rhodea]WKN33545.1 DNA alkylation repair protein [Porifericola rhodea]